MGVNCYCNIESEPGSIPVPPLDKTIDVSNNVKNIDDSNQQETYNRFFTLKKNELKTAQSIKKEKEEEEKINKKNNTKPKTEKKNITYPNYGNIDDSFEGKKINQKNNQNDKKKKN